MHFVQSSEKGFELFVQTPLAEGFSSVKRFSDLLPVDSQFSLEGIPISLGGLLVDVFVFLSTDDLLYDLSLSSHQSGSSCFWVHHPTDHALSGLVLLFGERPLSGQPGLLFICHNRSELHGPLITLPHLQVRWRFLCWTGGRLRLRLHLLLLLLLLHLLLLQLLFLLLPLLLQLRLLLLQLFLLGFAVLLLLGLLVARRG